MISKKNNILSYICIILGLILTLTGSFFTFRSVSKTAGIIAYDKNTTLSEGKKVYTTGDIKVLNDALDPDLDIRSHSLVLIRNVEMVQYYRDEAGVRLVLANYPIESFDSYINPEFPKDITSKIFYSDSSINDITLDESIMDCIYLKDFSQDSIIRQLTDLPEDNGNNYNLVLSDNSYITASDDWNLGDIKLTYYYIDETDLKNFTILGQYKDSKLSLFENSYINNTITDLSSVKKQISPNSTIYIAIMAVGLIITVAGITNKKKSYVN